jgi:hypothetical protein
MGCHKDHSVCPVCEREVQPFHARAFMVTQGEHLSIVTALHEHCAVMCALMALYQEDAVNFPDLESPFMVPASLHLLA